MPQYTVRIYQSDCPPTVGGASRHSKVKVMRGGALLETLKSFFSCYTGIVQPAFEQNVEMDGNVTPQDVLVNAIRQLRTQQGFSGIPNPVLQQALFGPGSNETTEIPPAVLMERIEITVGDIVWLATDENKKYIIVTFSPNQGGGKGARPKPKRYATVSGQRRVVRTDTRGRNYVLLNKKRVPVQ